MENILHCKIFYIETNGALNSSTMFQC